MGRLSDRFDLEAEIRDLAARRDIAAVTARYMRGLDRIDRDLLLGAFHDDAFVDCGVMQGNREEFADFALGFLGDMGGTHHMLGQSIITLHDVSNASGEWYFQAYHDVTGENGEARDLFISGRYVDEYACREGQWRIAKRTLVTDWVTDTAGSRAFFEQNPTAPRGLRQGRDFSQTRDWPTMDMPANAPA
nr:nuclear transport factor 2 family protein [Croceicoccus ponticola]